jgi:hypothetical protein
VADDDVSPLVLGAVERDVGLAMQLVGIGGVAELADADADREAADVRERLALDGEAGALARGVRACAVGARQDPGELLAADARDVLAKPRERAQPPPDFREDAVVPSSSRR